MQVFNGQEQNNEFTWSLAANNNPVDAVQDTAFGGGGGGGQGPNPWMYVYEIDSLDWINCDEFINDPRPKTTVEVTIPVGYNPSECAVFVSFDGMNSMMSLYQPTFKSWMGVPVGAQVHFIVITEPSTGLEYDIIPATVVNNHVQTVQFKPTTKAQLTTLLQNLP